MVRLFLTGDTHGSFRERFRENVWPEGRELSKKDLVIILGDFGGLFWPRDVPKYEDLAYKQTIELKWLESQPWTTLFIDGNHENFNLLYSLPEVEMFGAPVGRVSESIFWLKRGYCYTIDNKKFFTLGGALSIDKDVRTPNVSWWKEEEPSREEFERALSTIEKHHNTFDYILTHTASDETVLKCLSMKNMTLWDEEERCSVRQFFNTIEKNITFHLWFFAHFHIDVRYQNYISCFTKIWELNDLIREGV